MKKNYFTIIMVPVFLLATGFIILRFNSREKKDNNKTFLFQKRKAAAANDKQWMYLYKQAEAHLDRIKVSPGDVKSKLALASLFIEESRAYGNHAYYDEAALYYVDAVLTAEPKNFEASILRAVLLLSQHRFEEAKAEAEKTKKINPYNAYVYGILTDANVELGMYNEAIANADQMVGIRPDIRSYSRVAYLREIHGDYPGAIEAMKMAIEAGVPGDEATLWTRMQLAKLFENTGQLSEAKYQYNNALLEKPTHAHALAGLGRLALHENNAAAAVDFFTQADAQLEDPTFKEGLAQAYAKLGNSTKVLAQHKAIIKSLVEHQHGSADDEEGHFHAGIELANAYIISGDLENALNSAQTEYKRRPKNIDVNECLAWVYYQNGQAQKAVPYIKAALSTNSVHPRLLCRAGLIYRSIGDKETSNQMLAKGLQNKPVLDPSLLAAAMAARL